jgi:hypothetical protein
VLPRGYIGSRTGQAGPEGDALKLAPTFGSGPARLGGTQAALGALYFFAEDDGFGDGAHGHPALAALLLEHEVGLLFAETEVALEDAFAALDDLARFEFFGEVGVFVFEAGHFDFSADQETDGGDQLNLGVTVGMGLAVLQVDDAHDLVAADDGHGEKGFVTVFRQFVEALETGIVRGIRSYGYGLTVFGDPSGDALPHLHFEAVDDFGMGVFGGAQHQIFAFEDVDEAGIAFYDGGDEIDDAFEDFVKGIGGGHAAADLMEKIDRRIFDVQGSLIHGVKLPA